MELELYSSLLPNTLLIAPEGIEIFVKMNMQFAGQLS